jgi:glycosyltransferase involved in cell wall biosynthesis
VKYSVIIPVYKNETSIDRLLEALTDLDRALTGRMEAVFVVDGSPDRSFALLRERLDELPFAAQLLAHSRNFGSFAAIRTGLAAARGELFAVMAADLQEPPELLVSFFHALEADECDVVIGTRSGRRDPLMARIASSLFWCFYRRWVVPEMPAGGVDIFGCNRRFLDPLLRLEESRSSLIALIFWLGFRRKLIGYERQARREGVSAWTWRRKIDYMLDSVFAFTDAPIRLLIRLGGAGLLIALLGSAVVVWGRLTGHITVPGYAPTLIAMLFFGAVNLIALGVVGSYAWRAYENTKARPLAVVAASFSNRRADEA